MLSGMWVTGAVLLLMCSFLQVIHSDFIKVWTVPTLVHPGLSYPSVSGRKQKPRLVTLVLTSHSVVIRGQFAERGNTFLYILTLKHTLWTKVRRQSRSFCFCCVVISLLFHPWLSWKHSTSHSLLLLLVLQIQVFFKHQWSMFWANDMLWSARYLSLLTLGAKLPN